MSLLRSFYIEIFYILETLCIGDKGFVESIVGRISEDFYAVGFCESLKQCSFLKWI